ncbi:MAG: tetratricopeptide repeat protein [Polyangiaceae bacterium]
MQRHTLQKLSREDLIREAERAGVPRPRVLTQAELIDEILKRTAASDRDRSRSRGWLGRARDLLATVVEKGLHLPDAAAAIRTANRGWPPPPPLPTVTLAEIYAAQGHLERAVQVLDEVLRRDPEHEEARELRARFAEQIARSAGSAPPAGAREHDEADETGAGEGSPAEAAADERAPRAAPPPVPAAHAARGRATDTPAPLALRPDLPLPRRPQARARPRAAARQALRRDDRALAQHPHHREGRERTGARKNAVNSDSSAVASASEEETRPPRQERSRR